MSIEGVAIAATAPVLPVLFVGILGIGACSIWMVAAANTLVQLRAEPELLGRAVGARAEESAELWAGIILILTGLGFAGLKAFGHG